MGQKYDAEYKADVLKLADEIGGERSVPATRYLHEDSIQLAPGRATGQR